MGDLSENFSRLEVQCPCGYGANKISSVLIEKLQKVRNIIGRHIIITKRVSSARYGEYPQEKNKNSLPNSI